MAPLGVERDGDVEALLGGVDQIHPGGQPLEGRLEPGGSVEQRHALALLDPEFLRQRRTRVTGHGRAPYLAADPSNPGGRSGKVLVVFRAYDGK
jgi:hypothetical protein